MPPILSGNVRSGVQESGVLERRSIFKCWNRVAYVTIRSYRHRFDSALQEDERCWRMLKSRASRENVASDHGIWELQRSVRRGVQSLFTDLNSSMMAIANGSEGSVCCICELSSRIWLALTDREGDASNSSSTYRDLLTSLYVSGRTVSEQSTQTRREGQKCAQRGRL